VRDRPAGLRRDGAGCHVDSTWTIEAGGVGSEGAVHSHARRALAAGASAAQVRDAVLLLVTTIGFPRAAAAMSWVDDVIDGPPGRAAGRT
jgi:Carboxymuconolactone decarboxylase family